jgi:radical SAM protein with 4Fe4S-binding SPASM domain
MRANAGELPDLVRLAADVGVDRLWLQALSHDFSDTEDHGDGCAGEGCGAGDGGVGVVETDRAAYVEIRRFTEDQALWADQDGIPEVMDEARRLAGELGLDLRLPDAGPPDPADPAGDGWPEGPEAPGSEGGRADGGDPPLPCDWPWSGVYVTHAGKVQPCCMVMGEDRLVLGDLSDGSFEDVWNGPTYQAFREELLSDRPPAVCRGCSWYRRVF